MSKTQSLVSGESFTYELLWSCCTRQMAVARSGEQGSHYFYLTAMTMAYFTFEAYVNHALRCVAPEIFENEKTHFSKGEYSGTPGKLKKLCELGGFDLPDTSRRPYQSIRLLQNLRDVVVHGKTHTFESRVKHLICENPSVVESKFDKFVSAKQATICLDDTQAFIRWLNSKLRASFFDCGLLVSPLSGFHGHSNAEYVEET